MAKEEKMPVSTSVSPPALFERWGRPAARPFGWLRDEMDRLFDEFGGRSLGADFARTPLLARGPALELKETNGEYRLDVEVPGMRVEDIDIRVADGVLRVSGERKEEKEEKNENYVFSERRYGSFERAIQLPGSVDAGKIRADCKDGVLTIHLPKSEDALSRERKIPISAA